MKKEANFVIPLGLKSVTKTVFTTVFLGKNCMKFCFSSALAWPNPIRKSMHFLKETPIFGSGLVLLRIFQNLGKKLLLFSLAKNAWLLHLNN